ncbi:phosphatases II [Choiromyces venosus 120613-1]|uniref:phosphatidylinositol-3,4,5-trisphosphate 3-phosphatase n=1 Tax=Choiromyces venosus 120613-1 TaxID=1336337 RepID=A0A3N4J895_9PEZI|nr:phosphatases II [Choiromyces venosus 120613-1]
MSMPATEFPKKAYRNPLDQVIKFLDSKHGDDWRIWEFRAEGTGYKDEDVFGRVFHAPFPDHHPPPFALVPAVLASMRNHLKGEGRENAVAVVHCKAGKGRSGTMCCAYLIGEEGWSREDALKHYTTVRMRPGFGEGVSIPSQRRWTRYIERWARELNKQYVERTIRIEEVHVHGLREGVRVAIQGYVDEGKEIKTYHTFTKEEQIILNSDETSSSKSAILKPKRPVILPTNDINIDFERRNALAYDWSMVTSISWAWFNAYFEGDESSGLFEIEWDAMDGIKGTLKKGTRAFDRLKVVWSVDRNTEHIVREPAEGEPIPQPRKAETKTLHERDLGLKKKDDIASPSSGSGDGSRLNLIDSPELLEAKDLEVSQKYPCHNNKIKPSVPPVYNMDIHRLSPNHKTSLD